MLGNKNGKTSRMQMPKAFAILLIVSPLLPAERVAEELANLMGPVLNALARAAHDGFTVAAGLLEEAVLSA
jgi:hypothetical protein